MRWRAAFFLMLAVWIVSVAAFGYVVIDHASLADDQAVARAESENAAHYLAELFPAVASHATRVEILEALRRQNPTSFIVATDTTVGIARLSFHFGQDGLIRRVQLPY